MKNLKMFLRNTAIEKHGCGTVPITAKDFEFDRKFHYTKEDGMRHVATEMYLCRWSADMKIIEHNAQSPIQRRKQRRGKK